MGICTIISLSKSFGFLLWTVVEYRFLRVIGQNVYRLHIGPSHSYDSLALYFWGVNCINT